MNDRFFIDTNVFVYSFDASQPAKRDLSLNLIQMGLRSGLGVISTQVIQEFLRVATRKFTTPLKADDCKEYLHLVFNPLCQVYPDLVLYETCLDIQEETGYGFFDSLILAGAVISDCRILYSEDLQDNQKVRGVIIRNPYR